MQYRFVQSKINYVKYKTVDLRVDILQSVVVSPVVGVISLIVHYKAVINKVEAVRASLKRVRQHIKNCNKSKGMFATQHRLKRVLANV